MERRKGIPLVPLVIFVALLVAIILVCSIILGLNKKNKKGNTISYTPETTTSTEEDTNTVETKEDESGEEITSEDIINEDEDIKAAYKLVGNGKTFAKYAIYATGGFDVDNDNIKNDFKLQLAAAQSSDDEEITLEKMQEYADKIFENNDDLEFKDFSLYSSDTNFTDEYSIVGYIYDDENEKYVSSKNNNEESDPSEITELITKAVKYSDKLEIYVKPIFVKTFYSDEINGMGCQLFKNYDFQQKEWKDSDSMIAIPYSEYNSILKSEYNRDLDHYKYTEMNSNFDLNSITEYKYTFVKDSDGKYKLKSFESISKVNNSDNNDSDSDTDNSTNTSNKTNTTVSSNENDDEEN